MFCYKKKKSFFSYSFQDFLFNSLAVMCLCLTLFAFILSGVHWVSQISKLMSFIPFGEVSPVISPSSFSAFSLSALSEALSVCLLVCLMLSHRSLKLCLLYFKLLFSYSFHWIICLASSPRLLMFLLPSWVCSWAVLVNFCFSYCASAREFSFVF